MKIEKSDLIALSSLLVFKYFLIIFPLGILMKL